MLGVDERAHAAELLSLGEDVVDERRLARRLGAEDLDYPAFGHAADPKRDVQRQRPGGNRIDGHTRAGIPHSHHGSLAELLLDLRQGALKRGLTLGIGLIVRRRPSLGVLLLLAHLLLGSLSHTVNASR